MPTPITASRVAVVIPCSNEASTIERVVQDFARELPGAAIYVFDNNSTDETGELATRAGARVVRSPIQGKGNVVQHMSNVERPRRPANTGRAFGRDSHQGRLFSTAVSMTRIAPPDSKSPA